MAVELSRWYDEVATQASGASIKGIELALKSTVAEFMRESAAFAMELPGLTLRANKSTYYIPRPDDGPIIAYRKWCERFWPPDYLPDVHAVADADDHKVSPEYAAS